MELYEAAIDAAERALLPARRATNILDTLTYAAYAYVQRGLFQRHKLVFALMLANRILVCVWAGRMCLGASVCAKWVWKGAVLLVGAGDWGKMQGGGNHTQRVGRGGRREPDGHPQRTSTH